MAEERKGPPRKLGRLYFEPCLRPGLETWAALVPGLPLLRKYPEGLSCGEKLTASGKSGLRRLCSPSPHWGSFLRRDSFPASCLQDAGKRHRCRAASLDVRQGFRRLSTCARAPSGAHWLSRPGSFRGCLQAMHLWGKTAPNLGRRGSPRIPSAFGGWKGKSWGRGVQPETGSPSSALCRSLSQKPEVCSPGVPHPSANVLKKQKESPALLSDLAALAPLLMECTHQIFIKVLLSET